MKLKFITVLVTNKKGDTYQVALTKDEREEVTSFLTAIHNGTVKVHKGILPIKLELNNLWQSLNLYFLSFSYLL